MPTTITPSVASLIAAVDQLAGDDPHDLADGPLLCSAEALITQRNRLDAVLGRLLVAMDSKETTVSECGRTVKGWLVEEQHLAPADAGARLRTARDLTRHDTVAEAFAAG